MAPRCADGFARFSLSLSLLPPSLTLCLPLSSRTSLSLSLSLFQAALSLFQAALLQRAIILSSVCWGS